VNDAQPVMQAAGDGPGFDPVSVGGRLMSEEKTLSASNDAAASSSATTRKKAPARGASAARRSRGQSSGQSGGGFGKAALESQARAQNPSTGDDPFESGQRIWPD
jgi:hypothetical protein